jgi:predicted nicotinamide N-methyase
MITKREFKFSEADGSNGVRVVVQEVMAGDFGLYVWPSARLLAEYISFNRASFTDKTILELGAGTCLPGLVAAKIGANVIFTDCAKFSQVLDNIRAVCKLNHLQVDAPAVSAADAGGHGRVRVQGLTWGEFSEDIVHGLPKIDLIIGADIFYDEKGPRFCRPPSFALAHVRVLCFVAV